MNKTKSERSGKGVDAGSHLVQERTLESFAVTMTARESPRGNIEAGLLAHSTPEGRSAASTARPSPRAMPQRVGMRFKERSDQGDTCDVVNCKRVPEIHVRGVGWLCASHWVKHLEEGEERWRDTTA